MRATTNWLLKCSKLIHCVLNTDALSCAVFLLRQALLPKEIIFLLNLSLSVEAEYNYKVYKLQSESIAIVIFVIARYYLLNEVSDTLNMVQ